MTDLMPMSEAMARIGELEADNVRLNSLHLPNYWDAKRAVEIFKTEYVGQDQLTLWKSIVAEVKSNE